MEVDAVMIRSNEREDGGQAGACETAGFPGGTSRDELAPVNGTCTQPSPARPQTSPLGLSCSGLRTPPETANAEQLTGNTSEPGAPSTPSIPSARGAEPDARPCADRGDGQAVHGGPATGTPEVPGKRPAVDSGHGPGSSGGESRSHHKRPKETTVATEGLPGLAGRLDNEENREQQRVPVGRRAQEIAEDQARNEEASRESCPGGRTRSGGSAYPPSEALVGRQPRPRRKLCGQASCGWTPSATDIKCGACPGEVVHSTTVGLCTACHRCLPGGKATHFHLESQQRARAFVQRCRADGVGMPAVVVQNFEPNGGCFCLREDCFHALFAAASRKPAVIPRCATCKQQKKKGKWVKVRAEGCDGKTVDDVGGASSDAAHLPSLDCGACYSRKVRIRNSEAAAIKKALADAMPQPRLPAIERVRKRVKDIVAKGDIVDWREAKEWLQQAREDDGEKRLGDDYLKTLMRKLFNQVARTPGCDARVVDGKGGLDAVGDGRRAYLLLFPLVVPDMLVVDLYLRDRGLDHWAERVRLNSGKDKE